MPVASQNPATRHMLPLRGMTEDQFIDVLMLQFPLTEKLQDSINKLETFIAGYAADERSRYEDDPKLHFTEQDLEEFEELDAVISPLTIRMYLAERHRKEIGWYEMSDAQKERYCLALYPGRFCAHFAENMNDPNAKPWPTDLEIVEKPKGYYYSIGKKGALRRMRKMSRHEIDENEALLSDPYLGIADELVGIG